jgi:hypothetical protein
MSKGKQVTLEDFKYVDCFHINPGTGQRTKWVRVEVDKIEEFRNQYSNFSVFNTIQTYRNKVRQEGGGELMYAPLFFDIDSSRMLSKDFAKSPARPGLIEEGLVRATELEPYVAPELRAHLQNYEMGIPLPDDISKKLTELVDTDDDLKTFVWLKNLEASRADAVKIIHFFMERFGMTEDEIRVYFSGSKGFHVLVNPIVLDVQPEKNLHRIFKFIATYLESQLGLRSLDTGSIYGHGRQLRMVNSIHHKSGLFKVELTHAELKGDLRKVMNKEDGIAKYPREDMYPPDQCEYTPNELAKDWFFKNWNAYLDTEKLQQDKVTLKDEVLSQMEGVPVCVQFVLERGILKNGDRNKASMALASYYKDIGYTVQETIEALVPWAEKIPKSMTSSAPSEVRASTISCVKTVYTDDRYHFGCAFIRSLHGERQGRSYESIPCAGRACPAHEDHAIDQEPAEHLHLSKTADAYYTGKKVATDVLVSGIMDTPYIVPKKVRYVCAHQPFCEKDCILHDYEGLMEREFHENERFLIEATNQNDAQTKGILFHHSHASCKKVSSEVLETVNVTEMLVAPMAERINTVRNTDRSSADYGSTSEVDEEGNAYVNRRIFAVGNPGDIPIPNMHFRLEGYVYSHPKNAMATMLTQKHEPKEDNVASFKLTPEVIEQFKVYQVAQGETLDDRISLIVGDLVDHVTMVRERFEPHLATLMTYHSCLHYYFQNQLEKRGWMEIIMVGDSGQAKTQLVSNLMEFAGLGNLVSGEGTSRTGLVYILEQMNERWFIKWGTFPLSDRKLLVVDEFSEVNPEDFGKVTEARTTGVLKVNRAGMDTETNARVRLALLTNPARARTLHSFTHGVEALKPLFASPADIRRLDIALFLQSGDVPKSVLNIEQDKSKLGTQLITSEVMRNSILWAWSRKADHIDITPAAMKRILKYADELAGKYGYATDIPLMEPSDLRKKLARMSISLASLVHSTDDAHEKVIVKPEHVQYAAEFIQVIYDNKNARLDVYSAKSKEETELTDEEREEVSKALGALDFADGAAVATEMVELFRKNDILKPAEIIDMLGYERGQVNARLAILTKHSMINRTREGLRKMPKFIEFLNT